MKRRNVILILLLTLSGGAIVNIAVAWGIVVICGDTPPLAQRPPFPMGRSLSPDEHRMLILELFGEVDDRTSEWITATGISFAWFRAGVRRRGIMYGSGVGRSMTVVDVGWPCYALQRREIWSSIMGEDKQENAWILTTRTGREIALPLRATTSGFLINTLFYAALLWLLFLAPFTARRMIRRRRGLCEKCAYPVGVSPVCTECGAAVRPKPNE